MKYMNLSTPVGAKIIFHGQGGYDGCKAAAANVGLIPNKEYTVMSLRVGRFESSVELSEFPGARFNTVMFSNMTLKYGAPVHTSIVEPIPHAIKK